MKIIESAPNCFRIPRQGQMKVDAVIYIKRNMLREVVEGEALKQLMDAASLPGLYRYVVGMPDIHSGFGLPIGGVMAMDGQNGLVSAGAVGMDINCGVRLLSTNIPARELGKPVLRKIMQEILQRVPTGIGKKSKHAGAIRKNFHDLLHEGVPALIRMGIGRPEDPRAIEEGGSFPGGNLGAVSKEAFSRGEQLSTTGGGNHFIELGMVQEIYDREMASRMGLTGEALTVFIHTGSRGFGHQICTDYTRIMRETATKHKLHIPTPGLAAVPIHSREGRNYLEAMACAINFAFCNRQWITWDIRNAFAAALGGADTDYGLDIIYDVAHNIAKFEEIDGKRLLIHRKGATRALPPGHPLNPPAYLSTGHPVFIPGSMGTASYVVVGTSGVKETFYSINHGAGRVLSRKAARKEIGLEEMHRDMKEILLVGRDLRAYLDEAPRAYKDIDMVVETLSEIQMIQKVARLVPLAVIKGEGGEG